MDIHTLYIIAYATSTTSSLGSCAILLFFGKFHADFDDVTSVTLVGDEASFAEPVEAGLYSDWEFAHDLVHRILFI